MSTLQTVGCKPGVVGAILGLLMLCPQLAVSAFQNEACPECVTVGLDLDSSRPGFQTTIDVPAGTRWVRGVTIWIFDPTESAPLHSIGYIGGLNRGIAFGHMPSSEHAGQVVEIDVTAVGSVIPNHAGGFVNNGIEKLFSGPELQYFDAGSTAGIIPSNPTSPILTIDIELTGAKAGDVFRFYLGDMTAVWIGETTSGPGGAFSTFSPTSLDAGGDFIPDGTLTAFGVDPDVPVPSPPALYPVDYVDSQNGGGATIRVANEVPAISWWGFLSVSLVLIGVVASLTTRRPTH